MLRSIAILALCLCPVLTAADRPPNVVVFFIDDMGYADIGPFGAKAYPTPHLDRMAAEGRLFTDFYVTQPVCSASRAGLLTGCYNVRVGITGALSPRADYGINADEVTLAEICKQKDYATAIYGKWHLGHHEKFLPLQHGFDEYYGLPYSNDMWHFHHSRPQNYPPLPLIDGNRIVDYDVDGEDQERLTTNYTERAVSFIEKNKDRPFFIYVPHTMVHVPLYVSDKFRGKSGAGIFGDVVMELDWSVGQVLDAVRRNGLENDTLVIFTADNGPWLNYGTHAGAADPLREGKHTTFDGGVREPAVMWWPGTIPPSTKCDEPVMTIDLLPTVASLIGAKLPGHKIDGQDITALIKGEPGAKSPHEALYFYRGRDLQAVRMGNWKLHFPHDYPTNGGRKGRTDGLPIQRVNAKIDLSLYDLDKDISETTNVAAKHPDVVAQIEKLADKMRQDLGDQSRDIKPTGARPRGTL
jgi:arylsulfatase A